jgi:alcohol dehydrogenase (cytochrome c)
MTFWRLAQFSLTMTLSLLAGPALAAPVTTDRLAAAANEPENWLMGAGDYGAARYSGLDGLTRENLGELKLLFTVSLGPISAGDGFQHSRLSAPLVDGGMVYVSDAFGAVYKIDVRSGQKGKILWTSERIPDVMDAWLDGQWSLTLVGDSVVLAAGDGRLFWIDRETGASERTARVADPATGYMLVAPPLFVDGKLIIGGAGGDRGARPQIDALDAEAGAPVWQTVPVGTAGAFTAGGSFLRTGIYDAETGLTLWSTSGPLPAYDAKLRQGDSAANSVLAFEAKTGAEAWRRALVETDMLGFNQAATPLLVPGGALHAGDDGVVRRLDVADGTLAYERPFVAGREWAGTIDAATGVIQPATVTTGAGCPNVIAEPNMPASFSKKTGLVYAAENNGCRADLSGIGNLEGLLEGGQYSHKTTATGALAAIDPATGVVVAERAFDYPLQSGVLSTAGGLVFVETADGFVHFLDDTTLAPLRSLKISSMMASPPISYGVDGRQYIAFIVGGGPLYDRLPYRTSGMEGVRHLSVLAVLGVDP